MRVIDGQLTSVPRCNAVAAATPGVANDPPCGGPISTSGGTNIFNGRFNDAFFQVALNHCVGLLDLSCTADADHQEPDQLEIWFGTDSGAYTWSHQSIMRTIRWWASAGESTRTFPRDSSGFAGGFKDPERGDSGFDVRHVLVVNFTYDLPIKFQNRNLDRALGGWKMSGIYRYQSGLGYSVFGAVDSAGTGFSQRADYASTGNPNNISPTSLDPNPRVTTGLDRTLFANNTVPSGAAPTFGTEGNTPRNGFRGPNYSKTDFSLIKSIPLTDRYKFSIRADFFNIFNRVNFGVPVATINSLDFGRSTFTVSTPRVIQFAGRFEF